MSRRTLGCRSAGGRGYPLLTLGVLLLWWMAVAPVAEAQEVTAIEAFHGFHIDDIGLACTDCHNTPEKPAPGHELSFSERPYHPACEDCHEDVFESGEVTSPICQTCHLGEDYEVASFPSSKSVLASFSHVKHVDPHGRVGKTSGIRQDCVFCHKVQESDMVPRVGGHPKCASCHAGEKPTKPELSKEDNGCLGCHSLEKIDRNIAERRKAGERPMTSAVTEGRSRIQTIAAYNLQSFGFHWRDLSYLSVSMGRRPGIRTIAAHDTQSLGSSSWDSSYQPVSMKESPGVQVAAAKATSLPQKQSSSRDPSYGDILPFNHGRHIRTRDGSAIDCVTCHTSMLESREVGGPLSLPTMKECASCHESAALVRQAYLIENCQLCHQTIRAEMRPLARDGFSPAIVHTESFRRHHADAARAEDSQCRFCHIETARAGQDNCAGCHSAMRPRSHRVVRFDETTHGRLAAMDRRACVSCHTSDFCSRCHNIPPRSHTPLAFFAAGGHRNLAIINLRSCLTCHTFENTCMECHESRLRR